MKKNINTEKALSIEKKNRKALIINTRPPVSNEGIYLSFSLSLPSFQPSDFTLTAMNYCNLYIMPSPFGFYLCEDHVTTLHNISSNMSTISVLKLCTVSCQPLAKKR